ncbi:MAG: hypothetical protein ABFD82_11690 [Syntrophaceae bacterium]
MTELTENHKHTLLIGFRYVDDLLSNIERVMAIPENPETPFPKYIADITPVQQKIIEAEIAHIRVVMRRILEDKGISIKHPRISARDAIRTAIHFADIAMEEKKPKYMKGYGELTEEAKRELNDIASQMQQLLKEMLKVLR